MAVTNGKFYTNYRNAKANFDPATFTCAEETVQELLTKATTSDHPGMLLGKVQSGKTRTFISILALAFDNGFDVAIILTKNSRPLAEQTKKRLEDEFNTFVDVGDLEVYDILQAPESFTAYELQSKIIFVVKKQDDNLRRLIDLVSTKCPALSQKRTLVIDDEADSASIGYSKKQEQIEANKIAKQISDLRSFISSLSFLQVTATPYSLYLQPDKVEVANTASFKPMRPKFTKLVPVPDAYVGGDTYFGARSASEVPTVESLIHVAVSEHELETLKKKDGRRLKLNEALTSPAIQVFRRAFVTFIVGGCIQRMNGLAAGKPSKHLFYSFLIHSEAGRDAHDWQEELVRELYTQLVKAAGTGTELLDSLLREAYDDLAQSLQLYSRPVPAWNDLRAEVRKALTGEHVTIAVVNSDQDIVNMLDKSGQLKLRTPLNIFIGGQVLDRGVTLANLIGFFYGRRPNKFQQDTVLQHSRMYGYRREDLAVTRFFTSRRIRNAMAEMEAFDSALRTAIESGGNQEVQFIRKAANGNIIPCSPNKILVASTQTLRPFRRLLPIGFQSGYKTHIAATVHEIDQTIEAHGGFDAKEPTLISLNVALDLLSKIEPTLEFDEADDVTPFDWDAARAALKHLSNLHPNPTQRGQVWLWAARGRQSARFASETSHARFIETPDSEKTEGRLAKEHATDTPILFLLRQDGSGAKGWRDTPFYWPVVRAQAHTPTVIYTAEAID